MLCFFTRILIYYPRLLYNLSLKMLLPPRNILENVISLTVGTLCVCACARVCKNVISHFTADYDSSLHCLIVSSNPFFLFQLSRFC